MRQFTARFAGTCLLCAEAIAKGQPIVATTVDDQPGYEHVWCAQRAAYKERMAAGETFASRKASTWRRRSRRM